MSTRALELAYEKAQYDYRMGLVEWSVVYNARQALGAVQ